MYRTVYCELGNVLREKQSPGALKRFKCLTSNCNIYLKVYEMNIPLRIDQYPYMQQLQLSLCVWLTCNELLALPAAQHAEISCICPLVTPPKPVRKP